MSNEALKMYIPLDGSVSSSAQLWKMRAGLPGFKSVMSVRYDEEICQEATLALRDRVFNVLDDLTGTDILEVGTGVGRFTHELASRAKRVVSFDFTPEMIFRAKKTVLDPNVSLLRADAVSLPLAGAIFDLVFELTVFMHMVVEEDFQNAINESKRVLKPNGSMFLCGVISPDTSRRVHIQLVHRSMDEYVEALRPLRIVDVSKHTCVDHEYTMMIVKG